MGQLLPLRPEYVAEEPWWSKKRIAAHFGVTTTTIDVWTRHGMPYERIGARRKFRRLECDAWHRSRRP